jgi:hypothetical protein
LVWEQTSFDSFWAPGFPVGGYDTYTSLDDEQNRYALIDTTLNRKLVADQDLISKQITPHLFDLHNIDLSQDGEAEYLNLLPAQVGEQVKMEAAYRNWRQQVGSLPVIYNAELSTEDTNDSCVDVWAENQVAVLEHNDLLAFREGDFSFQVQLELDDIPTITGATIAEHPGSWNLSVYPATSPAEFTVQLDVVAKDPGLDHPGLPGDLITVSSNVACVTPCSVNIGFTVLGIVFAESSLRLYIDGETVDEFRGNGVNNAPYFKEVFASGSEAVLLGNDSSRQSTIQGRLIDPRFYSLNLSPTEISRVMNEQAGIACTVSPCH